MSPSRQQPIESASPDDESDAGPELGTFDDDTAGTDLAEWHGWADTLDISDLDEKAVPTLAEREQAARLPSKVHTEDILGHEVVWVAWRPQRALLPDTGEITDGYFALGKDLTTNRGIAMYIGGIALCRVLKYVEAPMRATIVKRGRTLEFK